MSLLMTICTQKIAFTYFFNNRLPRFYREQMHGKQLSIWISVVKVEYTSIFTVILNSTAKVFSSIQKNKFNFALAMILFFVFHPMRSISMVPLTLKLSRIFIFLYSIVTTNIFSTSTIFISILDVCSTTTSTLNPGSLLVDLWLLNSYFSYGYNIFIGNASYQYDTKQTC